MGQVPVEKTDILNKIESGIPLRYAIVGSGKLARHLKHYFLIKKLPLQLWSRNSNPDFNTRLKNDHLNKFDRLRETIKSVDIVCLALSDGSLEGFYNFNKQILEDKFVVHFSGALTIPDVYSAHPLMSFGNKLYDKATYESIPFITEKTHYPLSKVFPLLPNPSFAIDSALKPLYHSYCVLAGNMSTILWQEVFERFGTNLKLPKEVLIPYLLQIYRNLIEDPKEALTGPLQRNDLDTIHRNLVALNDDSLQQVYESFVSFKAKQLKEKSSLSHTQDNKNENT
ncbi:MAG: DUF2520 domain-containing protein [Bdellovibrionales bacterium]|nr:DUF2520 domain-containing protein [Bdellovibrionales bacterium]